MLFLDSSEIRTEKLKKATHLPMSSLHWILSLLMIRDLWSDLTLVVNRAKNTLLVECISLGERSNTSEVESSRLTVNNALRMISNSRVIDSCTLRSDEITSKRTHSMTSLWRWKGAWLWFVYEINLIQLYYRVHLL